MSIDDKALSAACKAAAPLGFVSTSQIRKAIEAYEAAKQSYAGEGLGTISAVATAASPAPTQQPVALSDLHKVALAIANTGLHGMPMEDCAACALAAINAMPERESIALTDEDRDFAVETMTNEFNSEMLNQLFDGRSETRSEVIASMRNALSALLVSFEIRRRS